MRALIEWIPLLFHLVEGVINIFLDRLRIPHETFWELISLVLVVLYVLTLLTYRRITRDLERQIADLAADNRKLEEQVFRARDSERASSHGRAIPRSGIVLGIFTTRWQFSFRSFPRILRRLPPEDPDGNDV